MIAWLLDGPEAGTGAAARARARPRRAILDTYTKEHSAEYQAQALIDLARRMRPARGRRPRPGREHRDPHQPPHPLRDRDRARRPPEDRPAGQPRDPRPLDHLHLRRRPPGRRAGTTSTATRPDARRPARHGAACGTGSTRSRTRTGRAATTTPTRPERLRRTGRGPPCAGGEVVDGELAVADAHPNGARPSPGTTTCQVPATLAEGVVGRAEQDRFLDRPAGCRSWRPTSCGRPDHRAPTPPAGASDRRGIF